MCGICGYILKLEIRSQELKRMHDLMFHRDPDDSGE